MWSHPVGRRVRRQTRRYVGADGGFSLMELLVVITILLVISAVAIPNLMRAVANMRLRSAANSVSGLLQEGRIRAVRDNTYYEVIADSNSSDSNVVCLDLNKNGTCTAASTTDYLDPQARLGGTNVLTKSSPPSSITACAACDIPSYPTEQNVNLGVYFNSRGLPCKLSGSRCVTTDSSGHAISYIYYVTDQRPLYGWTAITVSPAGRIRVWMYNGSTWEQ